MQAFIRTMLETNGGCELPCWWGITPGQTSWQETQTFFTDHGINIQGRQLDLEYLADLGPKGKHRTNMLDVTFQQESDKIQSINIRSDHDYTPFKDDFVQVWQRYALAQVLSQYGIPSRVYLNLITGAPCIGSGIVPTYDIWVIYDKLGIAVRYSGTLIVDNQGWLACPLFGQTRDIEIQLQPPDTSASLIPVEMETDQPFLITGTLTDLTDMSPQEFYESFRQPEPQVCLMVADPFPWREEVTLPPESRQLSRQAEDSLLVERLANNSGCELPCWWGITPGTTSWQETQQVFLSYGKSIASWDASDLGMAHRASLFGRHDPYPFDYVARHTLYERDGQVYLLEVAGHALGGPTWYTAGWPLPQFFAQDWQRYSLSQVLAHFGKPSQVLLHYWPEEGSLYNVAVMYDDRGILVEYMGAVQGKPDNRRQLAPTLICPTPKHVTDINLWLKAPDAEPSLTEIFSRLGEGYYILPFSDPFPSLEEATGMSLETFYQTYLDPSTQVCLEAAKEHGAWYP